MDAQEQGLKVEPVDPDDHDLAVDHVAFGQRGGQWGDEFRKVSVHGLLVAALQQDLVAVAKHQRSKAVPLGLELPSLTVRQGVSGAGQHRGKRWSEGQAHGSILEEVSNTLQAMWAELHMTSRERMDREASPWAGFLDSQSIKSAK